MPARLAARPRTSSARSPGAPAAQASRASGAASSHHLTRRGGSASGKASFAAAKAGQPIEQGARIALSLAHVAGEHGGEVGGGERGAAGAAVGIQRTGTVIGGRAAERRDLAGCA